jgi:hypothetical protein
MKFLAFRVPTQEQDGILHTCVREHPEGFSCREKPANDLWVHDAKGMACAFSQGLCLEDQKPNIQVSRNARRNISKKATRSVAHQKRPLKSGLGKPSISNPAAARKAVEDSAFPARQKKTPAKSRGSVQPNPARSVPGVCRKRPRGGALPSRLRNSRQMLTATAPERCSVAASCPRKKLVGVAGPCLDFRRW